MSSVVFVCARKHSSTATWTNMAIARSPLEFENLWRRYSKLMLHECFGGIDCRKGESLSLLVGHDVPGGELVQSQFPYAEMVLAVRRDVPTQ